MIHHPIQALIVAYLTHSAYLTGKHFFYDQDPEDFVGKYFTHTLLVMVVILLAPFLYWLPVIWEALKKLWTLFQCQFFFYFWFTSKYDNCPQEQLYGFNDVARRYHQKDTFRDQVWRYAVECLNTRFGYTYVQKKESDEDTETHEDE